MSFLGLTKRELVCTNIIYNRKRGKLHERDNKKKSNKGH